MINNDRQYSRNSGYAEDIVDYEPEMTSRRNINARQQRTTDFAANRNVRERNDTAGFEELIKDRSQNTFEDDLVPSGTTMQFVGKDRNYVYEDMNDRLDTEKENVLYKEGMSSKSKIMIAVYAIVVLTIFTLIIMNTRLLKTMNKNISEQEARIVTLTEENAALNSRYEQVSSDEEVIRRAVDMGMVKVDG